MAHSRSSVMRPQADRMRLTALSFVHPTLVLFACSGRGVACTVAPADDATRLGVEVRSDVVVGLLAIEGCQVVQDHADLRVVRTESALFDLERTLVQALGVRRIPAPIESGEIMQHDRDLVVVDPAGAFEGGENPIENVAGFVVASLRREDGSEESLVGSATVAQGRAA